MTVTTEPKGGHRALRADARRNVQRVLAAAEQLFASEGLAVPIDVIAANAGVGVGTVYRHFPTKEALFKAVVVHHLETLVERCKQLSACEAPCDAVFTFIAEVVEFATQKRDLTDELVQAGIDKEAVGSAVREELERAFDLMLRRAQAAGSIRPDVTAADVTALLMGTCMAAERRREGATADRLVKVVCDGLRTGEPTGGPAEG